MNDKKTVEAFIYDACHNTDVFTFRHKILAGKNSLLSGRLFLPERVDKACRM